jgi:nucleoside-diphosphate-sugar epimerase
MRITVLGGTRFIGRRVVADLVARGDEVQVVHRGETEPDELAPGRHLHVDRAAFSTVAAEVAAFAPDAVIDAYAMSRSDVDNVLPHLPDTRLVLLSSMDVYQAFHHVVLGDGEGEPVPVAETGRLRATRYIYRGGGARPDNYEKLDVEPSYLERGATVLRLPMVYGEHDHQRREEFVLRRVRAGRRQIPVGAGDWLWTRAYVGDVSKAVLACLANPAVRGEVLNIGEPAVRSIRGWAVEILAVADHEAELVPVPEAQVPEDLWLTKRIDQHVLVDCGKAVRLLDWHPDPRAGLARSVAWHLAHPPADASDDFTADDAALATA